MKPGEVYLVMFPNKGGREFYGRHYAVVLTKVLNGTLLVAPITGKKGNKKYRRGITLDNSNYQANPTYAKSYICLSKIQEIDKRKIIFKKKEKKNQNGELEKDSEGNNIYIKEYKKTYELNDDDYSKLKIKLKEILQLT